MRCTRRAPLMASPTPVVARCKVAQLCREESDGVFVESKPLCPCR